ncbi:MAG: fructan beta-fructosidase, partial [Flavobacteriaceae bacterium]
MKTIKEVIFISALFFSLISCNDLVDTKKQTSMTEFNSDELKYRPSFHFSPKKNWMNDPNGMFFYK